MSGPPPKPAHLRQRVNKKSTHAQLPAQGEVKGEVPAIPNPDGRVWHPLTVAAWASAWLSPMASQFLDADVAAMGRLAVLWDAFNQVPTSQLAAEIRLQEQRFGLTPLDRSRLQWEIARGDEAVDRKRPKGDRKTGTHDPRNVLSMVK